VDVQCERCKTEYEFDDALVSGRGTTVRCTNCGHQFKVRRTEVSEPGVDRWVVETGSGQQLTFLTLRELQRAILAKQVARGDVLSRGTGPPRTLGSIAELEPFFEGRTSTRPPPGAGPGPSDIQPLPKRTATWGSASDGMYAAKIPGAPATPQPPPAGPPRRTDPFGPLPDPAGPPRKVDTLRPPAVAAAPPPPPSPPAPSPQQVVTAVPHGHGAAAIAPPGHEAPRGPPRLQITPTPYATMPTAAAGGDFSSPLPPPTRPVRQPMPTGDDEIYDMRPGLSSAAEEAYAVPRRRRVGGWVVALVLLAAVGVVGWVVAKPYLAGRNAGAAAQLDPRAQAFLADGEKAMAEGNLDLAQGDFDKASALAEKDPRVLLDEARIAAARADVPWLKLRLLAPDQADDARATRAQLDDASSRARNAAEAAMTVAPDDAAAVRAKIDALRIGGDRDGARKLVTKVSAQASQPDTAYVIAALDLAEPEPIWTTVIDRLRLAAAAEGNAGRARALLVYALAKSGDVAGARAELAKLDAAARPYPLLPNLHAFVDKAPGRLPLGLDGGLAANVPHIDVSALPSQGANGGPPVGDNGGGAGDSIPSDSRGAMQAANAAIKKGDWGRARQIYEALSTRNPSDSEAIAGIGDCARATGDSSGAIAAYKRALSVNPSYLPALLGLADTQWASGDRAGAVQQYKSIVDRFPEGSYPAYVKTRAEGSAPAPPPSSTESPTPSPAPSPPTIVTATPAPSATAPKTPDGI
jgi:predicted Zn finger-like uncharacterized protein